MKSRFSNRPRFLFLLALAVLLLDQASKHWLVGLMEARGRAPLPLCDYFSLVMAWNRGVSFSLLAGSTAWMPYVLVAVAVVISALLARLALKSTHRMEQLGYALVVGGALGNALDRLRFGAVADFFYAHVGDLGWPAFNVADMAICAGVGLLLLSVVKHPARP